MLQTMRPVSVVMPMTAKSSSHFSKIASRLGLAAGLQHHQHALLAFRQHHLVGRHAGLALGTLSSSARCRGRPWRPSRRRGGEAGRAHVLDGDDGVGRHQFEAGLEQQLLGEGVADLHGRALLLAVSSNSADAMVAPWMPSRPVLAPR
jgi:hypothetical protein